MKEKNFRENGKVLASIATVRRLLKPYCGSGRLGGGDSWFTGVGTAIAARKDGLHWVGEVKTIYKGYPKQTLLDYAPSVHGDCILFTKQPLILTTFGRLESDAVGGRFD